MTSDVRGRVGAASLSASSQLGAKVVHLVLNVVSSLAIVRYLAPDAYGTYVLVLTIVTMAGVVADFGLPKLAVREMVRPGEDADAVAGTIIGIRIALAVLAVLACQVAVALFDQPPSAHLAAGVASLVIVADAVLGIVVVPFQVSLAQHYEAVIRVVGEALETGLILVLVALGATLPWLFAPPVVGVAVALVLAVFLSRRRFALHPRWVRAKVRPILVEALPLGPALLVGVLYLKLDSFVVAALRPPEDLGLYGAAYQPIEYLFLGTAVIINVLYPLAARAWSGNEAERFRALYRRGTEVLVIATLVVPAVLAVLAQPIVEAAFGTAYDGAVRPLQVLSIALVVMAVNAWQSLVLLSGGYQRLILRYNLAALAFALVLCGVLVSIIGVVGAAISALATALFVLVASTVAVHGRMAVSLDPAWIARALLVALVTLAVVAVLTSLGVPWILAGLLAVAAHLLAAVGFGFHRTIREAIA